jgi:hypothetical protein
MQAEDLNNLGLGVIPEYVRTEANEGNQEKGLFVSGLGVPGSTKWHIHIYIMCIYIYIYIYIHIYFEVYIYIHIYIHIIYIYK